MNYLEKIIFPEVFERCIKIDHEATIFDFFTTASLCDCPNHVHTASPLLMDFVGFVPSKHGVSSQSIADTQFTDY